MIDGWFDRLKNAIETDGRPAKDISRAAGLGQNYVQQMVKRDQPPKIETLDKLLGALGDKAAVFVRDGVQSSLSAPVAISGPTPSYAGVVRAGQFLAVDEYFNQDPESVPDFVTYDPAFKQVRQYAWKASGDSMNEAGIHDGMWIVGADAADYIDRYGDIESGELVVVERTRFQGSEREITVKEVRYYRDRYELHPRSSNPAYKPIIVPHDHGVDSDGMEVKIIGLVLTAYTNLKRRRPR